MGDFNHPNKDWGNSSIISAWAAKFLNSLRGKFMEQLVESPSRNTTVLDLVITNNADLITEVKIKESIGNSDH